MTTQDAASAAAAVPADRRRAWLVFAVIYFAAASAPFNQAKVPPLIPVLVDELHLSLLEAGLLMSVFSFTGILLAIPAGLLFSRFGPRRTGIFSIGCTALGSLLGSTAPNGQWLLATRLVEGIGLGMIAVLALSTIAAWFPSHERGLPVSIFSTWIPVGSMGMLLLAPLVYEMLGWRAVWLVGGLVALVCLAFYALLANIPGGTGPRGESRSGAWFQGMLNPSAWLLALAFASFTASRTGFITWAPTYLTTQAGFDLASASLLTSLNLIIPIPTALVLAWALDRVGSRRKVYSLALLLLIPSWVLVFKVHPTSILAPVLITGVLSALIPTAINAAAPETARDPQETGPAVGITAVGRNAGQVVGPAVVALVLQGSAAWDGVPIALAVITALGVIAGWLVRVK